MKHLIILSLLGLSACASVPVYQAKTPGHVRDRTGYSEQRITNDVYRVKYTSIDTNLAYKYFLTRAAELAKASNFDYFSITDGLAHDDGFGCALPACPPSLPVYEGTVHLLKAKADGAFGVSEILADKQAAK
jgi:hypothetical protein